MKNNFIYHFTTLDSLKKILQSNTLRISHISKMNDINENTIKYPKSLDDINSNDLYLLNFLYKRQSKYTEFEQTKKDLSYIDVFNQAKKELSYIYEDIYSISFSQLSEKEYIENCELLWAHYGDKHKGVSIKFNKENLINLIKTQYPESFYNNITYLSKVDLKNNISLTLNNLLKLKNCKISFKDFILNSNYFHKLDCWSYENEFRVITCNPSKKEFLELNNIINCIDKIILGYNCESYKLDSIPIKRCYDNIWLENMIDTIKNVYENFSSR